jgi:hypothetical protein
MKAYDLLYSVISNYTYFPIFLPSSARVEVQVMEMLIERSTKPDGLTKAFQNKILRTSVLGESFSEETIEFFNSGSGRNSYGDV